MHHEPVWKFGSLPQQHAEILELIGWIRPKMREALAVCDDFPAVYASGRAGMALKLKAHLGIG